MLDVTHRVSIADPHAHLLELKTTFASTGAGALPSPLVVFMPVWAPGSYLVREYGRHVEGIEAESQARPLACRRIRTNAWEITHDGAHSIEVRYRLYANDLTVRTNHVDTTHAYWNGAATYLASELFPALGARVVVDVPADWEIATVLERDGAAPRAYVAKTFDELCDAPFECGKLITRSFSALRRQHAIVAWDNPDARAVDWDKLKADTTTIVHTEATLIAGDRSPEDALPYSRYLFLWHVSPRGRGGLEHRDCATLMAKPASFQTRSGYLDVLSLIAHEFFHLWNVKRIRPAGLVPLRYEEENYTRLLWWFEGATSYYDWRTLAISKLCTPAEYLNHLAEEIARLEDTPGALVHSLEESSFDAWIKAYRPDENSLNSTVSYYLKGEVVCALFDLTIRQRSANRASLDDVLRHLYWEYGAKDTAVPEGSLSAIFRDVTGVELDDCFARWVTGTERLDVNEVLAYAGLSFERGKKRDGAPASLGVRLKLEGGRAIVDGVPRGGAAHRAGIDVRDEIIAVDGRRLSEGRPELPLAGLTPGTVVPVMLARDGRVFSRELELDPPVLTESEIAPRGDTTEEQRNLFARWMGEPLENVAKSNERPT